MVYNKDFIQNSLKDLKYKICYVLECVTVNDSIKPFKFSVAPNDLTVDPTTVLPNDLAPYRRSLIKSDGWSTLHDFIYMKNSDTNKNTSTNI